MFSNSGERLEDIAQCTINLSFSHSFIQFYIKVGQLRRKEGREEDRWYVAGGRSRVHGLAVCSSCGE